MVMQEGAGLKELANLTWEKQKEGIGWGTHPPGVCGSLSILRKHLAPPTPKINIIPWEGREYTYPPHEHNGQCICRTFCPLEAMWLVTVSAPLVDSEEGG